MRQLLSADKIGCRSSAGRSTFAVAWELGRRELKARRRLSAIMLLRSLVQPLAQTGLFWLLLSGILKLRFTHATGGYPSHDLRARARRRDLAWSVEEWHRPALAALLSRCLQFQPGPPFLIHGKRDSWTGAVRAPEHEWTKP